jgi:hypothetical protein
VKTEWQKNVSFNIALQKAIKDHGYLRYKGIYYYPCRGGHVIAQLTKKLPKNEIIICELCSRK